tara:strand:+ start:795 stop:1010 length:216 start_codon:yes stop_codon:yes gene_type:complete
MKVLVKHETVIINTEWHYVTEEQAKLIEKGTHSVDDFQTEYLNEYEEGDRSRRSEIAEDQTQVIPKWKGCK